MSPPRAESCHTQKGQDRISSTRVSLGPGWEFQHVGSTSVPGLLAKPVIDIAIGMPQSVRASEVSDRLRQAGWSGPVPVGDHWSTVFPPTESAPRSVTCSRRISGPRLTCACSPLGCVHTTTIGRSTRRSNGTSSRAAYGATRTPSPRAGLSGRSSIRPAPSWTRGKTRPALGLTSSRRHMSAFPSVPVSARQSRNIARQDDFFSNQPQFAVAVSACLPQDREGPRFVDTEQSHDNPNGGTDRAGGL